MSSNPDQSLKHRSSTTSISPSGGLIVRVLVVNEVESAAIGGKEG